MKLFDWCSRNLLLVLLLTSGLACTDGAVAKLETDANAEDTDVDASADSDSKAADTATEDVKEEAETEKASNSIGDDAVAAENDADVQKEDAEKEEEEKDPFEVPDGDAEALLDHIKSLRRMRPPQGDEDAFMEFVTKAITSSNAASDKLLAGEATDEQAAEAVEIKLQMLQTAEMLGLDDLAKTKDAFLSSLKEDKRPTIVAMMKNILLVDRASNWEEMEEADQTAFLGEIVSHLESAEEITPQHIELVSKVADTLEEADAAEAAGRLYLAAMPIFKNSDDEKIVKYASRFEGIARRLTLIGSEMEIEGTLLDGTDVDWASYKGKVVLVDFWATWCGPCVHEMPNVKKAYQQYNGKGFEVLAISLDDSKESVEDYMEEQEIPWKTLYSDDEEANGWSHPMASYYGIQGIPATILIGADGKVISLSARGPDLQKQLQEVLGDPLPVEEEAEEGSEEDSEVDVEDDDKSDDEEGGKDNDDTDEANAEADDTEEDDTDEEN